MQLAHRVVLYMYQDLFGTGLIKFFDHTVAKVYLGINEGGEGRRGEEGGRGRRGEGKEGTRKEMIEKVSTSAL